MHGVILAGLLSKNSIQHPLFDDSARIEKIARIYNTLDRLSERFGKHTVQHASRLPAKLQARHEGERGDVPRRMTDLFRGENRGQGYAPYGTYFRCTKSNYKNYRKY